MLGYGEAQTEFMRSAFKKKKKKRNSILHSTECFAFSLIGASQVKKVEPYILFTHARVAVTGISLKTRGRREKKKHHGSFRLPIEVIGLLSSSSFTTEAQLFEKLAHDKEKKEEHSLHNRM